MFQTRVESIDDGKVKMTVTVQAQDVDTAVKSAAKKLSKEVRVPGFRPGKAPRKMLEQMLGTEYLLSQAAEDVINETYARALDKESLRVIDEPSFDDPDDLKEGAEFTYAVSFSPRPVMKLTSTDIEVKMPPREVTDAEVDAQIESTRERMAGIEPVEEERAIKDDDFVLLSFTSTLDGEDYEGSTIEKFLYELGRGNMPEAFEKALIGAKAGDKVSAEFDVEDNGTNSEFAGKKLKFDIEIHEIKQKSLPAVDDELAHEAGFETLEEMRKEITDYIASQKENSYDRILGERLVAALADNIEGDIPQSMIEDRQKKLKGDFEDMLKERNMPLEQYLQMSGATFEQYDEDTLNQARAYVAQELALEALANDQKLEVSEDDFVKEFADVAEALKMTPEAARAKWEEFGLMTTLHDEIMRRKASDYLREHGKVTIEDEAL